jgi:hypothetical protein
MVRSLLARWMRLAQLACKNNASVAYMHTKLLKKIKIFCFVLFKHGSCLSCPVKCGFQSSSSWPPLFECTNTKALWMVTKEVIVLIFNLILILIQCLNNKCVAVHNKCSKIPPSTSMHFATRVQRSRVFRLSWSSRFFTRAAASKLRASSSSLVSTLLLYTSLFKPTHKNLTKSELQIQTSLSR